MQYVARLLTSVKTTHYSLFTTHFSLFMLRLRSAHRFSLFTSHMPPSPLKGEKLHTSHFTSHASLLTTHYSLFTLHASTTLSTSLLTYFPRRSFLPIFQFNMYRSKGVTDLIRCRPVLIYTRVLTHLDDQLHQAI
jgi:hypothetical protein